MVPPQGRYEQEIRKLILLYQFLTRLSRRVTKSTVWFPTKSSTNRAVQPQEKARGVKKDRDCTIHVEKTNALISFAATAKLICAFVFVYADCWFSRTTAEV